VPSARPGLRQLILPGLFVLGLIALRVPVMLAHLDSWYPFEIFSGNVAAALVDGVSLDVSNLYIIKHIRGGSLFGLLAAPLYWAFGSTTLMLKLVPLLWNALALGLLVAVMRRHFSRRAAVAVGLVFLLPSPLFAKLTSMGFATHMESVLLTIVTLHLFLCMTREGLLDRRRFVLFGLMLGLGASFHLQCLLAGLLMTGLLVLQHPRRCLSGALPALLGALLGAAPMLLFEGGDAEIGSALFGTRESSVRLVGDAGAQLHLGVDTKLSAVFSEGLAPLLEFGELGPRFGPIVAHVYTALLAWGCLALLWRERRGLLALPNQLRRGDHGTVSPMAFFALHALAVGVLFIVSIMPLESWFVGTGMNGRRLVPMLFSIMVMGALGLTPAEDATRPSRWGRFVLGALCLLGGWGTWASAHITEASRVAQRGECYEWFLSQLTKDTGNDLEASFDTLAEIDRGDWRFATLRFAPRSSLPRKAPLERRVRWALVDDGRPDVTLLRLTLLGRQLGTTPKQLDQLVQLPMVHQLNPVQRAALFHGVGLGTPQPRPVTDKKLGVAPRVLLVLAAKTKGADRVRALEGFGFNLGFVFEPYNPQILRRISDFAALDPALLAPVCRGIGWGHRQRYVEPPQHVPDGLVLLDVLPENGRDAFREGYLEVRLPPEAAVLTSRVTLSR
jgi:hypothetical protein